MFEQACSLDELKAKGRLAVHGRHRPILLVHEGGRVLALDNRCPHMGFPLDRGTVEDGILTCHWHHARFDLASGRSFDLWADDVPACPVEICDGEIWVKPVFGYADPVGHWRRRLTDGLAHNLGLVIAKAAHGQLAAGLPTADVVQQTALFGARNRDGWGIGLTILTALGQLLPCFTAHGTWLPIATAKGPAGSGRPWRAGPMWPRSSAGSGAEWPCAIARRPNAPCSPP